jgi:hypothetical protein
MIDTMFSPCRKWRYALSRKWTADAAPRFVNFILLNPSTADETQDDPTIRRCRGFAEREGFKAMVVTNLFAFRATKPRDLFAAADPVGPDNDVVLFEVARAASGVILGWGNHGSFQDQDIQILTMLRANHITCHVLGWTKGMEPRHPLYLPSNAELLEVKAKGE